MMRKLFAAIVCRMLIFAPALAGTASCNNDKCSVSCESGTASAVCDSNDSSKCSCKCSTSKASLLRDLLASISRVTGQNMNDAGIARLAESLANAPRGQVLRRSQVIGNTTVEIAVNPD
jgi:hypothetical protein